MKRILNLCLVGVMLFSLCTPALAANTTPNTTEDLAKYIETATPAQAKNLSVDQLQTAAQLAKTDEQANIVLEALLDKVDNGLISPRAISDTYVTITSTDLDNGTVTVNYEIISKVPSLAYLELGIKYPASTRMPAKIKNLSTLSTGTYSEVFSVANVVAKQVYTLFRARDYTSTDVHETLYMTTSSTYDYHTLTAAEVVGHYAVVDVAPAVIAYIFPQSKIVRIGGIIVEAAGISYTIASALDITKGLPSPEVGQYYETRTWYSGNKLYAQVKVWDDKSRYEDGERPTYDSGSFVAVTLPDF